MECHSPLGPQTHTLEHCFYSHTGTQEELFGNVLEYVWVLYNGGTHLFNWIFFVRCAEICLGQLGVEAFDFYVGSWLSMFYIWRCLHGNVFSTSTSSPVSRFCKPHLRMVSKKKVVPLGCRIRVRPLDAETGCVLGVPKKGVPRQKMRCSNISVIGCLFVTMDIFFQSTIDWPILDINSNWQFDLSINELWDERTCSLKRGLGAFLGLERSPVGELSKTATDTDFFFLSQNRYRHVFCPRTATDTSFVPKPPSCTFVYHYFK